MKLEKRKKVGVLELPSDDGYRGGEAEKEKIKLIIQRQNSRTTQPQR